MILNDLNYDELNPGIRGTVRWLRSYGFDTGSSGDGVTHECPACDAPYPFVTIMCKPKHLLRQTRALVDLLCDVGLELGEMTEDGPQGVCVQAGYEPVSNAAWIELAGLEDNCLKAVLLADAASYFEAEA